MSFRRAARSLVRLLARLHVPQLDGLVPAPADDAFAVGAERHTADEFRVSLEGEQLLTLTAPCAEAWWRRSRGSFLAGAACQQYRGRARRPTTARLPGQGQQARLTHLCETFAVLLASVCRWCSPHATQRRVFEYRPGLSSLPAFPLRNPVHQPSDVSRILVVRPRQRLNDFLPSHQWSSASGTSRRRTWRPMSRRTHQPSACTSLLAVIDGTPRSFLPAGCRQRRTRTDYTGRKFSERATRCHARPLPPRSSGSASPRRRVPPPRGRC